MKSDIELVSAVMCLRSDKAGLHAWNRIRKVLVESQKTSTNTTNGKIKPCSDKECANYSSHERDGSGCQLYGSDEVELCADYRA